MQHSEERFIQEDKIASFSYSPMWAEVRCVRIRKAAANCCLLLGKPLGRVLSPNCMRQLGEFVPSTSWKRWHYSEMRLADFFRSCLSLAQIQLAQLARMRASAVFQLCNLQHYCQSPQLVLELPSLPSQYLTMRADRQSYAKSSGKRME